MRTAGEASRIRREKRVITREKRSRKEIVLSCRRANFSYGNRIIPDQAIVHSIFQYREQVIGRCMRMAMCWQDKHCSIEIPSFILHRYRFIEKKKILIYIIHIYLFIQRNIAAGQVVSRHPSFSSNYANYVDRIS